MSKKKPYSEVEFGKNMRALAFAAKRDEKTYKDAPEWFKTLLAEFNGLTEKALVIGNELHVQTTPEDKVQVRPEVVAAHSKKYVQLLEKRLKAVQALAAVDKSLVDAGFDAAEPCREGCQCDCTECKGK